RVVVPFGRSASPEMTDRSRVWLLVLALIGLAASVAPAYVHYRLLRDPSYTSACDISATISCTQVYMSRFGTFGGVPVAVFGAIWFGTVLLLVAGSAWEPAVARDNTAGYLFALSTIGLSIVLYLGYASFFVLKTVCILCLATYAWVVGIFLISGAITPFPMTTLPRRVAQDARAWSGSPLAIAVTVLFLGAAASAVAFFPREGSAPAAPSTPLTAAQESEVDRFMASA